VDINDLGQVVGSASYMALLWQQGSVTWLGTLATGKPTHGWGINTQGQVVGFAQTASGPDHAFLWLPEPAYGLPAGMNDLGTLGPGESKCYGGINDLGQVVGWSDTGVTSEHAFLWEDGMMYDLNDFIPEDCGWTLYKAFDINNGGQIVGFGAGYGGRSMFLLTPIPEPATVGLLALGLAATLAARRKR
jgi:probable HAF family extracellular repeat protein